jgi:hypothetical protein
MRTIGVSRPLGATVSGIAEMPYGRLPSDAKYAAQIEAGSSANSSVNQHSPHTRA